jgi:soluble lytic murein transglycosylase
MDKGGRPSSAGTAPGLDNSYDDKNLALAYELGIQRMRDDAIGVLKKEERRYGATIKGIKKLAGLYAMVDEHRRPLELASELYKSRMDSGRSPIPDDAMEFIFPAGYWEVIRAESIKNNVDPFLVASLIREESHFDPKAVSPAGALGLMQMMPATAAEVCRKLDMSPPKESDLKDGSYNIPLGVCHLSYLIKKHDGRLVYILAEYNAGPAALKRWCERMPKDISDDEFVERIGYRETRNYIKRVLRNYYVYQDMYGS